MMRATSGAVPPELAATAPGVDWISKMVALDECDGYVLVVFDPQTGEIDAFGPYDGPGAIEAAEGLRASLDAGGLDDVAVRVTRMHLPSRG